MNVALGPFMIAALLLIGGGVSKAIRPGDTANALRVVGVPIPDALVRFGGAFEAGLGGWALLASDRVSAVLLVLSYVAFATFVVIAIARGAPIASCGCFGRLDTPPSSIHLVVDAVAVMAGIAVAIDPGDGFFRVVEDQTMYGAPYIVLLVLGGVCAMVALSVLPRALSSLPTLDD